MKKNQYPHSEEAERGVLGSILIDSEKAMEICTDYKITGDSFWIPAHRHLYEMLWKMRSRSKPIDLLTVGEYLKAEGQLDQVGSYGFLEKLMDETPTSAHIEYYAGFVKDKEGLRSVIDTALKACDSARMDDADLMHVVTSLQSEALSLGASRDENKVLCDIGDTFITECIEDRAGTVPHFCDEWTKLCGKLRNELVILHAPRSTGKTAWMVQWHRALAHQGIKVAFLSLESLMETIYQRYLAQEGRINTLLMRSRDLPEHSPTARKAREANERLRKLELEIQDGTYTINRIRTYANVQKKLGAKVIFIDNLLCISGDGSDESRTQMYLRFLQELREIRNEIEIPIVTLAHPKADGTLAWSSDAENLVDILIYMYDVDAMRIKEPEKYKRAGFDDRAVPVGYKRIACKFQKNRDGDTPRLELDFQPAIQTFHVPKQRY